MNNCESTVECARALSWLETWEKSMKQNRPKTKFQSREQAANIQIPRTDGVVWVCQPLFYYEIFVQAGPFRQCRCLLSPAWSVGKTDLPEKKIICFQKCKLLQDEWFPYHKLRIFRTTDILIDQKSGYSTLSFVLLQKKFQILGFLQSTRQINASGTPFFLSSAAANERTSDHKLQRGSLCYSRPPERKNRRERLTESCHLERRPTELAFGRRPTLEGFINDGVAAWRQVAWVTRDYESIRARVTNQEIWVLSLESMSHWLNCTLFSLYSRCKTGRESRDGSSLLRSRYLGCHAVLVRRCVAWRPK